MSNTPHSAPGARELLARALQEASGPDVLKAIDTFRACAREYLKTSHFMKAIAVAKRAKSVLGPHPRVRALLVETFLAAGLVGDAKKELECAAQALGRDDHHFLAALDDHAFLEVLAAAVPVAYPKGRIVVRRNETGKDVFTILEGACEVAREGKTLAVLRRGDVFGEISFFGSSARSATVKTLERSLLLRLPCEELEGAIARNPLISEVLEGVYGERLIRKASEDMDDGVRLEAQPEPIATLRFSKGQEIPINPQGSVAIVKHGIVEVDYDNLCLKTKRYYRPGSILARARARAVAGTDVVIVLASVPQKDRGDKIP